MILTNRHALITAEEPELASPSRAALRRRAHKSQSQAGGKIFTERGNRPNSRFGNRRRLTKPSKLRRLRKLLANAEQSIFAWQTPVLLKGAVYRKQPWSSDARSAQATNLDGAFITIRDPCALCWEAIGDASLRFHRLPVCAG